MIEYSSTLALITGISELLLAVWAAKHVIKNNGRRTVMIPVVAMLIFLAGYQLIEVLVCGNTENLFWSRLAFADIIWLPPLGVWFISAIAWPKNRLIKQLSMLPFLMAAGLTIWVLASKNALIAGTVCQAVVAAYQTNDTFLAAYGIFYQLGMLAMMTLGVLGLAQKNNPNHKDRQHLLDITIGTLLFTFLASMAERAFPDIAVGATPSVMCHFAISLAIGLARITARETHN